MMLMVFLQSQIWACDWSKDIKKENGKYTYTSSCHAKVGVLIKENDNFKLALSERKKQVEKLDKSLELKDLALQKADKRVMNWREESYNQHQRLIKQQKLSRYNEYFYFGGGVFFTALSVWAAGKLNK
jgi:hypothetical protein